jgi:hypothetical protein
VKQFLKDIDSSYVFLLMESMMQNVVTDTQGDQCPFAFNFDPATFKEGDTVSYRVPERFGDMPFVGVLVAVGSDHVLIAATPADEQPKKPPMRGTRTSRPEVSAEDALM